ncbi:MAG: iron-sulfur cluster-binding protein [Verrucomicrobia bacterium]|nr:iron-sulfur cluster-binding protein [Verrucomicrobiota bacterium]MCH8510459.1 iron-sulfur cluster-binding protein [Kiritimatiellia bacterium]
MTSDTPAHQFQEDSAVSTADFEHRQWMQDALHGYENTRGGTEAMFGDFEQARQTAAAIKWEAIENLDTLLGEFADKLEARGTRVFWAGNGKEAVDYILGVCKEHGAKNIIKSKCMTTEEIHLNPALEAAGMQVVESDLGEYIVQLREEPPFHFVFPAMHLKRDRISQIFEEKLGTEPSSDPEELTMIARRVMRQKYCEADIGISGANFAVADSGMISITENEGNARLTTSLPKVHIAVLGIEKVVPKLEDLSVMLQMLGTAGTGQWLTAYNSMIGGPRQPGEVDGPEEFHVVLLDNHRTKLLADPEQRDALRCIRCGACLNVCPIFKNIGGHNYGTTYQGPIGSVITPHLRGLQSYKHLSFSSSLCGACSETCPVKIDLHHHLMRNRRNAVQEKGGKMERWMFGQFAKVMTHPKRYRGSEGLMRFGAKLWLPFKGRKLDPLKAWTASRDLPAPAPKSFMKQWQAQEREQEEGKS